MLDQRWAAFWAKLKEADKIVARDEARESLITGQDVVEAAYKFVARDWEWDMQKIEARLREVPSDICELSPTEALKALEANQVLFSETDAATKQPVLMAEYHLLWWALRLTILQLEGCNASPSAGVACAQCEEVHASSGPTAGIDRADQKRSNDKVQTALRACIERAASKIQSGGKVLKAKVESRTIEYGEMNIIPPANDQTKFTPWTEFATPLNNPFFREEAERATHLSGPQLAAALNTQVITGYARHQPRMRRSACCQPVRTGCDLWLF